MNLLIDNKSGDPIYHQIYTQLREQILDGALGENELLPSIRALAKDLRISFLTTKRAYDALESEGFIYTVPGKGCYVAAKNPELLREETLKEIETRIAEIGELARRGGIGRAELWEMLQFGLEELGE